MHTFLLQVQAAAHIGVSSSDRRRLQTEQIAGSIRSLVHTSQSAMTAGVMPGEFMKQVSSPMLDLAVQVDTPDKLLEQGSVELAPNVRARPPPGAFSRGSSEDPGVLNAVEMRATAWAASATPFPGAVAPPRRPPRIGPNQMIDNRSNETATQSTVMATSVLSLEFAAEGGEEIDIAGLAEPFVIEMQVDPSAFACESVSEKMIMCEGSCVLREGCNDRAVQYCSYYDTKIGDWVTDGRSPLGNISADRRTVTCLFNHLTDMGSFMGAPPSSVMVRLSPACPSPLFQL